MLEARTLPQHQQDTDENGIFKLTLIHASLIYQIPWICWIHRISVPARKNSVAFNLTVKECYRGTFVAGIRGSGLCGERVSWPRGRTADKAGGHVTSDVSGRGRAMRYPTTCALRRWDRTRRRPRKTAPCRALWIASCLSGRNGHPAVPLVV